MGIPTYFRFLMDKYINIVKDKKEKECHYFFLDFNSILYKVFYDNEKNKLSEDFFLYNIIEEVKRLCNEEICPSKMIFFALDGPCPRAKMVQQRSRRYKSVQLQNLLHKKDEWIPSNNICPGTDFMYKFKLYLLQQMKKKLFHCPEVILSDSSYPGEGEQKILPFIKKLIKKDPDSNVVIMSPDNDLLSLSILTQKKNISILRYIDFTIAEILKKNRYSKHNLIYIDINSLKHEFKKEHDADDEINILLDYNFLLSMIGNDFVPVLPYMKIKNGGLDKLIRIYHQIFKIKKEYLIHKKTLHINIPFFIELVSILSKMENKEFSSLHNFFQKEKNGKNIPRNEQDLSQEKIHENRLNHLYLMNPYHPLYEEYISQFQKIPYSEPVHQWKQKYYSYFVEFQPEHYNKIRNHMVHEYLKSLKFTLLYYNKECPSWSWYYPYRVPPLFSDIYTNLTKFNIDVNNDISFTKGTPYSPFEQLALILPPQSKNILPPSYDFLFQKYKYYFPSSIRIDALHGLKYIYSEAILPEWDCFLNLLSDIRNQEKNLSPREKERNKIHYNLYRI